MPPKKKKGKGKGKAVPPQQQQQPEQPQQPQTTPRAHEAPADVPRHVPETGESTRAGKASTSQETEKAESKKPMPITTEELGTYLEQALTLSQPPTKRPDHEASADAPPRVPKSGKDTRDGKASTPQDTKKGESKQMPITTEVLGIYLDQALTPSPPFQKRPDYGTRGRKIGLTVNYFPLELPNGNVYHYDVEISLKRRDSKESASATPDPSAKKFRCLNTKKNREVINTMIRQHREFQGYVPAYDGQKNLYTRTPLKVAPITKLVTLPIQVRGTRPPEDPLPRADVFEVAVKPVYKKETNDNAISLDTLHALYDRTINEVPQEAVMAIETILRNGPCFRYVPLSRSFFYPPLSPDDVHPLGGGKEIWFGFHQSLILAEWKPVVNINVTATTFRKSGPLIDYIGEILERTVDQLRKTPQLRDPEIVVLSKKLKGVRIKVSHLAYEREYRVLRLTREAANRLKFPLTTNQGTVQKTVSDYFLEKYKMKLEFAQLPCLQVHPELKKVYLPLEVCDILQGQHSNEKMTESQTSEMIRVASLRPEERFRQIQQVLRCADFNSDPCNVQFGVRVSPKPLNLDGRVIDPPNVMYCNEKRIFPRDGSWEMKPEKFFKGADIDSWVILSFVNERFCNRGDLQKFAHLLQNVARENGINLRNLANIDIFDGRNVQVGKVLEKFRGAKLAVVVLQGKSTSIYGEVKQAAETVLGLMTQCIEVRNVKSLKSAVMSNICQKINAKMGGINCSLTPGEKPAVFSKPVIIIGADVTHPSPGSEHRPSIAAAVGSLDSHPSRYAVSLRAQRHTDKKKKAVEMIQELKSMILELMKAFYRSTSKKPEKIIYYRDGVSEGQFADVRKHELGAIRDACRTLQADYKPAITFIVVQKRHHTRFIPRDLRDGVGPKRNVPPGTVVDRVASSRIHFDFFLCSHYGLQGTSRPAHYTVISDDSNFSSDELQKLSYYLCHIYARCTRSISKPAPVQYAHLAAARAAKYLATQLSESSSSSDISDAELRILLGTWENIIKFKPELKNEMFFV